VARPAKELKGFANRHLAVGESVQIVFNLTPRDCAWFNVGARAWQVEAGTYGVLMGQSAGNLVQAGDFEMEAALLPV
jgi:hypothetical protein